MKEQQRVVYRSMQGKEVDMNKLMNQNELTVAIGNVKVNARGDELGPGGRIISKVEDVVMPSQHIQDEIMIKQPVEQPILPNEQPVKSSKIKNVSDMDPEGNE
jgi:hypothetical protein